MDPVTQGVLGAALPQSMASRQQLLKAGVFGLLAGMAPDLDVLLRSSTDPLLFLEYHRQFTHSLLFIPFGGMLCGGLLFWLIGRRWGMSLVQSCVYCTLGYATHGLLDSCTTYGTQLFWPFSNQRIAWNTLPIVDPLYTLPILVLVVMTALKHRRLFARLALIWALIYPGLGYVQRERATEAGWQLAAQRGHVPLRLEAKPSFANVLVWKVVYETEHRYFVDAVRVATSTHYYPGESAEKLDIGRDFPWLDQYSQQAKDIERFRWFSNGYIAKDPVNPNRIIDVRYSMVPNEIAALWAIELSPLRRDNAHVQYQTTRETNPRQQNVFRAMLFGDRL